MYKVFFNDRQINLSQVLPESAVSQGAKLNLVVHLDLLPGLIGDFLSEKGGDEFLVYDNVEKLWKAFKNCFIFIQAAGGVVREGEKFLFIFRRGKWDLPKGKIDSGESAQETALREVEEECGISALTIKKQLPSTWHIYQSPYKSTLGKWVLKETCWFEMNHFAKEVLVPQTLEGISEIKFVGKMDFNEILQNTYPNIEQIIRLYL